MIDPGVPAVCDAGRRVPRTGGGHSRPRTFTESFPLFGFELRDYEKLFEEKLDLFAALITQSAITWSGTTRPALSNQQVFPKVEHGTLKTWIGVGGSPESVVRAAQYDLPLMLAIIGGDPARFVPYAD